MDIIDIASSAVRRCRVPAAFAIAWLLIGCAHAPLNSEDALSSAEHLRLGNSYEAQGLHAEAVVQYQAAANRDPACAECLLALGNVAFTEGRFKDAESSFREVLKSYPHNPSASNNLAMNILASNGSMSEAEALAQDALAHGGALKSYILDTLANIFLRQKRYAEAAAAIDQAETDIPSDNRSVRERLAETRRNIAAAAAEPAKAAQENNDSTPIEDAVSSELK